MLQPPKFSQTWLTSTFGFNSLLKSFLFFRKIFLIFWGSDISFPSPGSTAECRRDPLLPAPAGGAGATPGQMPGAQLPVRTQASAAVAFSLATRHRKAVGVKWRSV